MDIEEFQQIARLTKEESEILTLFRNLAESKKKEFLAQLNAFTYTDEE